MTARAGIGLPAVADALIKAGFSVIPIRPDGSKAPAISEWKRYQTERMAPDDVAHHFKASVGIAIIGGAVSGNLEIIDVEHRAPWDKLGELIEEASPGLLAKLPIVRTAGGGYHIYIRCETIQGNQKLAMQANSEVLVETRGEGGYVLAPGSPAACHKSGNTYDLIQGRITQTPVVTAEERDILLTCCRSFNTGTPQRSAVSTPGAKIPAGGRHSALLSQAGRLRAQGAEQPEILDALIQFNEAKCDAPKSASDVKKLADDVVKRYPAGVRGAGAPVADERPMIDADIGDLPTASRAAVDALQRANVPPRLFNYGGNSVRIEQGDDGARAVVMGEYKFRHEMARAARYYVSKGKDPRPKAVAAPMDVVRNIIADENAPFPPLRDLVHAPVLKLDGTILQPGYDPTSRLYLHAPDLVFPQLDGVEPSRLEIDDAVELIGGDLLGDFPFKDKADKANAFALVVLPFLREHIDGPTPLHLIQKPTPGTGATLFAEIATYPATGKLPGFMIEGRDEDEWRKRLTTILLGSPTYILIDNLRRPLESAVLAAALTGSYWEDRLLGTNTQTRLPIRCAWIATGNNPTLSQEIARRTVSIRLDAKVDQPWLRDGFSHPDLRGWVRDNRRSLVLAALVLARAWYCASPKPSHGRRLGMYEDYSRVMGGVLKVAGIDGFLDNLAEFYATADVESAAKRGFLCAWLEHHDGGEVGTAELFPLALGSDLNLGDRGDRSQKTRLGKELGRLRDMRFSLDEGVSVVVESLSPRQGLAQYRLRRVSA